MWFSQFPRERFSLITPGNLFFFSVVFIVAVVAFGRAKNLQQASATQAYHLSFVTVKETNNIAWRHQFVLSQSAYSLASCLPVHKQL